MDSHSTLFTNTQLYIIRHETSESILETAADFLGLRLYVASGSCIHRMGGGGGVFAMTYFPI